MDNLQSFVWVCYPYLDILTIDCIGMVERIKSIINYYKLTDRAFAIKCNIKQNTLSRQLGGTSEVSLSTIDAILSTFEDVSSEMIIGSTTSDFSSIHIKVFNEESFKTLILNY